LYGHCGYVETVRPIGEVEVYFYIFLTTALEGGEDQVHAPAAFYHQERHGTHCAGVWVDPRVVLAKCGKFRPHRDSIPGTSKP